MPYLDSTSIMELDAVPEHLLVLGGGYIGLEFGQMFRRFGSRVTIIQRGAQLLGREDPDIADAVLDVLREDGIDVLLETEAPQALSRCPAAFALACMAPTGTRTLDRLAPAGCPWPDIERRSPRPAQRGDRDRQARLHPGG